MNPKQIRDLVHAAVQAVSDLEVAEGRHPLEFRYGRASDIWLQSLENGTAEILGNGGMVHYEMRFFTPIQVLDNQYNAYPVRLIISRSHEVGQDVDEDLTQYITDMYDLKVEIIETLKGNRDTYLTADELADMRLLKIQQTDWQQFVYGSNLTTGVIVNLVITSLFCSE